MTDDRPTFLGQLHSAEMGRREMARFTGAFCRTEGARYRPHPGERDRLSRWQHARWRRQGIELDDGSVPLRELPTPVVSVFSTGILEAAARGVPAWAAYDRPACVARGVLGALRHVPLRRRAHARARHARARARRGRGRRDRGPPVTAVCVIPARGGSKGVPGKNLREVAGKPLIVWTIEQALAVTEPLEVVVSTDDDEIAAVARAAGASVPFLRPAELAQDTTATEPVVRHALATLDALGTQASTVMLLQATSPGTPARAPSTARSRSSPSTGVDSMVGVVPQAPFLWWAGDPPRADYAVDARPRRQDLTSETLRYRETGSLYVTKRWVYDDLDNRLGGRIGLFVMDEVEGTDVDTELDLAIAEQQLRGL